MPKRVGLTSKWSFERGLLSLRMNVSVKDQQYQNLLLKLKIYKKTFSRSKKINDF